MSTPISLTYYQVALAAVLILINGAISALLGLKLGRRLFLAAACTVIQLLLVGLVLEWVFRLNRWYAVLGVVLVMTVVASIAAVQRTQLRYPGIWWCSIVSVWASSWLMAATALFALVQVRPW